mmetsp:Transcript_44613/g.100980  ORF Transcript_44613/g.100980 Transcript_44613/m.100980 type:complete len:441 (-) Transcript_44613:1-1323(-)
MVLLALGVALGGLAVVGYAWQRLTGELGLSVVAFAERALPGCTCNLRQAHLGLSMRRRGAGSIEVQGLDLRRDLSLSGSSTDPPFLTLDKITMTLGDTRPLPIASISAAKDEAMVVDIPHIVMRNCKFNVETEEATLRSTVSDLLKSLTHALKEEEAIGKTPAASPTGSSDPEMNIIVKVGEIKASGLECNVVTHTGKDSVARKVLRLPDMKFENFSKKFAIGSATDICRLLLIDIMFCFIAVVEDEELQEWREFLYEELCMLTLTLERDTGTMYLGNAATTGMTMDEFEACDTESSADDEDEVVQPSGGLLICNIHKHLFDVTVAALASRAIADRIGQSSSREHRRNVSPRLASYASLHDAGSLAELLEARSRLEWSEDEGALGLRPKETASLLDQVRLFVVFAGVAIAGCEGLGFVAEKSVLAATGELIAQEVLMRHW